MKRFIGTKILMLTLTLLFGSVAETATERPFHSLDVEFQFPS